MNFVYGAIIILILAGIVDGNGKLLVGAGFAFALFAIIYLINDK